MKAKYLTNNRQLTFEIEGDTQASIFSELAAIQEIFDTEHACGICGCTKLRYVKRTVDGNDFYELRCTGVDANTNRFCGARFDFGQVKKPLGTLFPKRKDKDGNWIPNRGWYRYNAGNEGKHTADSEKEPWG